MKKIRGRTHTPQPTPNKTGAQTNGRPSKYKYDPDQNTAEFKIPHFSYLLHLHIPLTQNSSGEVTIFIISPHKISNVVQTLEKHLKIGFKDWDTRISIQCEVGGNLTLKDLDTSSQKSLLTAVKEIQQTWITHSENPKNKKKHSPKK